MASSKDAGKSSHSLSYRDAKLSPSQSRAWFLELLEGIDHTQYVWTTYTFTGPLDLAVLHWCLLAQMQCHELLNICVKVEDGRPFIQRRDPADNRLPIIDLSGLPTSQSKILAQDILANTSSAPPLHICPWRLLLIKCSPTEHLLRLICHRVVADDFSLQILLRDLAHLYLERLNAGPILIKEYAHDYYSLVAEQQERLESHTGKQLIGWWARQLENLPKDLPLHRRRKRPKTLNGYCQIYRFQMSQDLMDRLREVGTYLHVTTFELLQTTFLILLRAYSGHEDIAIATFRAGRNTPETEDMVGPFENVVPLRCAVNGGVSFRSLLATVGRAIQDITKTGVLPFARLMSEVKPPKYLDRQALVQVGFRTLPQRESFQSGPLQIHPYLTDYARSRLDFCLAINPSDLNGELTYARSLFGHDWPETFINDWQLLIKALVDHPDDPIETLAPVADAPIHKERESLALSGGPPRDWVEIELMLLLAQTSPALKIENIHLSPFDLGMDSFQAVRFLSRLRKSFALFFPLQDFFATPTIAGVARKIRMALYQREMPIPAGHQRKEAHPPLSDQQKRLWFLQQLKGDGPIWHHALILHLAGITHEDILTKAFAHLLDRHICLHTTIGKEDGLPVSFVSGSYHMLPLHDLSHLPPDMARSRANEIIADKMRKRFMEGGTPLLRPGLIRLDKRNHLLLVVAHRMICDHWSMQIMIEELTTLYNAFLAGRPSPLPHSSISFSDYVHWQQGKASQLFHDQLEYWAHKLVGIPVIHSLATDHTRPNIPSYEGDQIDFEIPQALASRLHHLSMKQGVSLRVTLQAAFAVLLARYSGCEDICLGTSHNLRHLDFMEHMIGPISNTLVLRHNLSSMPHFNQFLRQVRLTHLQAIEHGDVPFEEVIEVICSQRSLSHEPLCQIMFEYQSISAPMPYLPDIRVTQKPPPLLALMTDLSLSITVSATRFDCTLGYATDLFEEQTIVRMSAHYLQLLESIVEDPTEIVSELNLHSEAELSMLLETLSSEPDIEVLLLPIARVIQKAQANANTIALEEHDLDWDYASLLGHIQSLAEVYRAKGIVSGDPVAIYSSSACLQAMGILACMAVGAIAVPLFPEWSTFQRESLLARSKAKIIVSNSTWKPFHLTSIPFPETVEANSNWFPDFPSIHMPALMHFTSDDEGYTVGLMLSHKSIALTIEALLQTFPLQENQKVVCLHSYWHDVIAFPILPLCAGVTARFAQNPSDLGQDTQKVDHCITDVEHVKYLIGRADTLWLDDAFISPDLRQELVFRDVNVQLWHSARETGSWWAVRHLQRDHANLSWAKETTGHLLNHIRAYIMDGFGSPTPLGGVGDLCLGSGALANAYAAKPALTAKHLVPDPFGLEPGRRLFRTGYKARFTGQGQFRIVANHSTYRVVAGQWFSPQAAKAILTAHKDVAEVAISDQIQPDQTHLLLWLRSHDGVSIPTANLLAYLQDRLLTPLPPLEIIAVDNIPRTVTDQPNFRELLIETPHAKQGDQAPRDKDEADLAHIFAEVLNAEAIGIHDNFFQLGGHSFLAVKVIDLIARRMRSRIPMRHLFESPSVALLAKRLKEYGRHSSTLAPFPHRGGNNLLTFAQHRLWYLDKLAGTQPFHQADTLQLFGPLEIAHLERAILGVYQRHQVLHSRFEEHRGVPIAHFNATAPELLILDLQQLGTSDCLEMSKSMLQAARQKLFNPEVGPCWRVLLLRKDPWEHVLMLCLHPIICDQSSLNVLLRDLATCYKACREGQPPLLPCASVQYADFAAWQKKQDREDLVRGQQAYWKTQLRGAPALHRIPTDFTRPGILTGAGHELSFHIPQYLVAEMEHLSHRNGTTLFVALEAIFAALLARYSAETDICIGTPVCYRSHSDLTYLIGVFTNPVTLWNKVGESEHFLDLMEHTRQLVQAAFANADIPFERVAESQQSQRNPGHHPLFQVTFSLHYTKQQLPAFSNLEVVRQHLPTGSTTFDLSMELSREEDGLQGILTYSTDLFDSVTIERTANHYLAMIGEILSNPEKPLANIELLNEFERELILQEWSGQNKVLPEPMTLSLLLRNSFAAHSNETCLIDSLAETPVQMTYAEISERAYALAARLRNKGAGPGTPVALYLARTPDLVSALVATLLLGTPVVPLNPAWPSYRQERMVRHVGAEFLIIHNAFKKRLPRINAQLLIVEEETQTEPWQPNELPAQHTACILHTSGASGKPKGVAMTQVGIANMIQGMMALHQLERGERVLAATSLCFDMALSEILWPLCSGGTLALTEYAHDKPVNRIAKAIDTWKINVLIATPTTWERLRNSGWEAKKPMIALSGGEKLFPDLASWLHQQQARVINLYGTTESSAWVGYHQLHQEDIRPGSLSETLPGNQIYILNSQLCPVPIGEAGEICLAGPSLTQGYHQHPRATAASFVPNPFKRDPGSRLYRTGDLARWHLNGSISFLGRLDRQLKIKGYRIEPGEIELALMQHPNVHKAAVLSQKDGLGSSRLTAYLESPNNPPPKTNVLKDFLRHHVPDHMIPNGYRFLDPFPTTQAGHADRQALYEMTAEIREEPAEYVAPRTPVEEALAAIWREVLDVSRLGVNDNFFQLGGTSQDATRAVARIRDILSMDLSVRVLWERPSIAVLSIFLEERMAELP